MVRDAETYAEQDKKRKEEAELRNQADSMVYQAERTLKDLGDKADAADREKVEKARKELQDALAGKDVEEIRRKSEALSEALFALTSKVYQQQAGQARQQQATGTEGGGGKRDNVVDADYRVMDDNK